MLHGIRIYIQDLQINHRLFHAPPIIRGCYRHHLIHSIKQMHVAACWLEVTNIFPFSLRSYIFFSLFHQIQFLSSQQMKVLKLHPWHLLQFEHIKPSAQVPYLPNFPPHISPGPLRQTVCPQLFVVVPYTQASA